MKNPPVGMLSTPKKLFPTQSNWPVSGKNRRLASLSAAVALIAGVGTSSAVFVDYLADRALVRTASASPAPELAPATGSRIMADASMDMAGIVADARLGVEPVAKPVRTEIIAALPAPSAIAKVAATVGPEHAVELPTHDPTATPILQLDDQDTLDVPMAPDVEAAVAPEPAVDDSMDDGGSDDTRTAAIPEEEVKPKRLKAAKQEQPTKAKTAPAQKEVVGLPGVDVGGLAGRPAETKKSTVTTRSSTRTAKATASSGTKSVAKIPSGTKSVGKSTIPNGTARVATAVNLRSRPENGSSVIAVVPAKALVNVRDCKNWCKVVYQGKTGWVYKSFVASQQKKKAGGTAKAGATAKADQPPQLQRVSSR